MIRKVTTYHQVSIKVATGTGRHVSMSRTFKTTDDAHKFRREWNLQWYGVDEFGNPAREVQYA